MSRVTIGVYFDEIPRRLQATLEALRRTAPGCRVLVLPDGVTADDHRAAAGTGAPLVETGGPPGAPARFNALLARYPSEVAVFLEAGCIPGPGWLDHLLAALESDPRIGMAGPSTNNAWNEQCAFAGRGGGPGEIEDAAAEAIRRFGGAARTLAPLYSLGDFCLAVKPEAAAAIGGADTAYGQGPCWEMDYHIRAARAGWRGVWAGASYVYRPPFTPRRAREEGRRLESSKHRYQDKFCALRLRGERREYEPHCRGDECEHFAPPELIRLREPLEPVQSAPAMPPATPLVTCVMVTGNRRAFALQSIRYFERQTYPNRELLILDDGDDGLQAEAERHPGVRYVRLPRGLSIGAKRNRGCELSQGEMVAQWDDDDWYGPARLETQIAPIVAGEADITGLQTECFFDLPRWRFWRVTPHLHRRLFVEDVHGGTLVYRRSCWPRAKYPECSLAEDAAFLRQSVGRGARLRRISDPGVFVYLRHQRNAWAFECGMHVDPSGWLPSGEPGWTAGDRQFYAALSPAAPSPPRSTSGPFISCIMPTAGRRAFVPMAIDCFLRQDYPERELLIVDDGADPVGDLAPDDPRIRYLRLPARKSIGHKRNIACEEARGDCIAHWDDDDWTAPWRLSCQAAALRDAAEPSVCGLSKLYFCDDDGSRAWLYVHPPHERSWIAGGSLCYHKELWRQYRFTDIDEGEDTRFIWSLPPRHILPLADHRFYVAAVHSANTSPKRVSDHRWQPRNPGEVRDLLRDDWSRFVGRSIAVPAATRGT